MPERGILRRPEVEAKTGFTVHANHCAAALVRIGQLI